MRKLGSATNESQRNRRFATFTILTFVTGILHCVSVTPTVLFYIALADASTARSGDSLSQKWYWSMISNTLLWIFLQQIFMYINSSFNFYFYTFIVLLDEIFVQILKTFYVAGWEMLLELITV
jgi:hypothetical protein